MVNKKLLILFVALTFTGGCLSTCSPWPPYDWENRKITGRPELVAIAKVERINLEREFGVQYDTELNFVWSEHINLFQPSYHQIWIHVEHKDNPTALRKVVKHELVEAFSWKHNGPGEKNWVHTYTHLNGHKIVDIDPLWVKKYVGP